MFSKNVNQDTHSVDLWPWEDLIRYQLSIATHWLKKGNKIENPFAKFFFYYAGFNALYFLWRKIDGLPDRPEKNHVKHLLEKFVHIKAPEILDKVEESVDYFSRRDPIRRMDKRDKNNLFGDESEGKKSRDKLQNKALSASDRIVVLGEIIYLVRCNLAHGSKSDSGDNEKIIRRSIEPLRIFLTEAISFTKQECPWEGSV